MPIYEYRCADCGWKEGRRAALTERNHDQPCSMCSGLMKRRFSAVPNQIDGRAYINYNPAAIRR